MNTKTQEQPSLTLGSISSLMNGMGDKGPSGTEINSFMSVRVFPVLGIDPEELIRTVEKKSKLGLDSTLDVKLYMEIARDKFRAFLKAARIPTGKRLIKKFMSIVYTSIVKLQKTCMVLGDTLREEANRTTTEQAVYVVKTSWKHLEDGVKFLYDVVVKTLTGIIEVIRKFLTIDGLVVSLPRSTLSWFW